MTTHSEIIDLWESIAEFARDMDLGYEAAKKMRARNHISPAYWEDLVEAAKAKGFKHVTYDLLVSGAKKKAQPFEAHHAA